MNRISREELEQLSKAEIIELFLKLQEQMIGLANKSEREIRMCKLKQKIYGCFRSDKAAKAFSCIRGYLSTMRKLGHYSFDALQALVGGTPIMPTFPPLLVVLPSTPRLNGYNQMR